MTGLTGRRVLITGATRGLGRAIADEAVAAGAASVVVTGRTAASAAEWARAHTTAGTPVHVIEADLSDAASAEAVVRQAAELSGDLDALVNAGATSMRTPLLETSVEQLETIFRTNVFGPYMTIAAFVRLLGERGEPGSIVNIASMSAHGGQPYLPAYAASKAAIVALTKNVAHSLRFARVRVNALNLGFTSTPGADEEMRGYHGRGPDWLTDESEKQPQGRLLEPREAARAACFLLGDDSMPTTGSVLDFAQRVIGTND